jgi:hypothetical protein
MTVIVLGVVAVIAILAAVAVAMVTTRARATADSRWVSFVSTLDHQRSVAEAGWVAERRELVNRVQAPQFVPRGPVTDFQVPELETDALDEVGQIQQLDEQQLTDYLAELS